MDKSSSRPVWLIVLGLSIIPLVGIALLTRDPGHGRGTPSAERGPVAAKAEGPSAKARDVPSPAARPAALDPAGGSRAKVDEAERLAHDDPKRARALLREVVDQDPEYVPALASLSVKLLADENHTEARAFSARCLALDEENERCTMVQNYALLRQREVDQYAENARSCVVTKPDDPQCIGTLAGYSVLVGKLDEATRYATDLERVAPSAKTTLFVKARVESAKGNYSGARTLLDEVCRRGHEQACFRAKALRDEGF